VVYLDTSCLLKLMLEEPESEAVRTAVALESEVVVSALTELETAVQLRAGWLAGEYREPRYRAYVGRLDLFRDTDPFRFRPLTGSLFATALRQDRAPRRVHCRTLDRLHLAAMEELSLRRLMTTDTAQAAGGLALGFEVIRPRRRR
jgi:predicted nucleic acid-binding protein